MVHIFSWSAIDECADEKRPGFVRSSHARGPLLRGEKGQGREAGFRLTRGRGGAILVGSRHATAGRQGRNQLLESEVRTVRSVILRGIIALVVTSFTHLCQTFSAKGLCWMESVKSG
jgi:hypothetical protein